MTPEGWDVAHVEDVFEIQLGKMLNKEAASATPAFPYLGNREVQWGRFDLSDLRKMHFSEGERKKFGLREGDLLVCEGGEVGRAALWRGSFECYFQKALHRLRPSNGRAGSEYMLHFMRFAADTGRLSDFTSQSSIAHLTREKLARVQVSLPPLPEQRKIAAILSSLDEVIESTQAVIDQLAVVKNAMMAELLTRGLPGRHTKFEMTEIGEIPAEWSVLRLEGLCSDIVDCPHTTPKYVDDGFPVIRTADVIPGRLLLGQAKRVSEETLNERVGRLLPLPGDIFYSREGERFGIAGPVPPGVRTCVGQRMMHLRAGSRANPSFLCWLMNAPLIYNQAVAAVGGSTSPHVNVGSVRRFAVPCPSLDEQGAIGRSLDDLETRILAQEVVSVALCSLKTALVSVLLTGEVRVKPDEDAA
jgi:type I restriction enzyme, S subunit